MIFRNPYIDDETKIRMLQRFILVHSYIYYNENFNVIGDNVYDNDTKQLIDLMAKNKNIKTEFSYVFKDFVSGTGFDLFQKLNKKHKKLIKNEAELAIRIFRNGGKL